MVDRSTQFLLSHLSEKQHLFLYKTSTDATFCKNFPPQIFNPDVLSIPLALCWLLDTWEVEE